MKKGALEILIIIIKVGFYNFEMSSSVMYKSKWAVSSKKMIEQMPYNVNKITHNKLTKTTPR